MKKEVALATVAVVLAFFVVQGAAILEGPMAPAVMKTDLITEQGGRLQETQLTVLPVEMIVSVMFGSFAVAALCYLLVRRIA